MTRVEQPWTETLVCKGCGAFWETFVWPDDLASDERCQLCGSLGVRCEPGREAA